METLFFKFIVIIAGLFGFVLTGMPIAIAIGGLGLFLLIFMVGGGMAGLIGEAQVAILNSFVMVSIPLFILMGNIMRCGGITRRLYEAVSPWVSFLPGGFLHTNIVSCAIFGAVSGSGVAGVATIGTVAIPELKKRKYPPRQLLGSIAGGGTLATMLPPSIPLILYGAWVGESVGKLFIAGIFPGILLGVMMMAYIGVMAIFGWRTLPAREHPSLKLMVLSLFQIMPTIMLIFSVLGSIYFGMATPTESAGIGCLIAFIISLAYREVNWKMLKETASATIQTTSAVFIIVVGAYVFSMAISMLRMPVQLVEWVGAYDISPMMILFFTTIMYMILGCIIDPTSMIMITLPIMYPLMMDMGFDSIWFGVVMALYVGMGAVTPPLGLHLFIIIGLSPEDQIGEVIKGSMPYFFIMVVGLIILVLFPQIATWLPTKMAMIH